MDEKPLSEYDYRQIRIFKEIEFALGVKLKSKHAKVIYWKNKGKDYRWIAQHIFNDEALEGTVRNYTWEVKKTFKDYFLFKYAKKMIIPTVGFVLTIMIDDNPDNIDRGWPPPLCDWEGFVKTGEEYLRNLFPEEELEAQHKDILEWQKQLSGDEGS